MSHAYWLRPLFDPAKLKNCTKLIAEEINADKEALGINAILVTGVSGLIIGGTLSYLTELPLVVLRKEEKSHSCYNVEFADHLFEDTIQYAFVDDLIASGETFKRVMEKMGRYDSEMKKVYLYNTGKETEFINNSLKIVGNVPISFYDADTDY